MELPLLRDTIIIFALSIAVIFLCHHIRVPAIVGFLLTGVVVGPNGLHLIHARHEVDRFNDDNVAQWYTRARLFEKYRLNWHDYQINK
jgi:NhaP-type Na+/H+ or K+/H+ antiporter